jgi:hypothetical protein
LSFDPSIIRRNQVRSRSLILKQRLLESNLCPN